MKRPPRIPTWALAVATAIVLGGAVTLFVIGNGGNEAKPSAATSTADDDSELMLPPDSPATSGARRRDDTGRTRIDTPDDLDPSTDSVDTSAASLARQLTAVRGTRVTLVAADALAPAVRSPTSTTRIGTISAPCATPTTTTAARTQERAVLDALTVELRAAGAVVTRVDDANGLAPCAPDRVAQFERADVALVVASTDTLGAAAGVASAVPAGRLTANQTTTSDKLIAALADALAVQPAGVDAALTRLLTSFGVLDLPGGGTTAWIVLPASSDAADEAHKLALGLAEFARPATTAAAIAAPPAATGGTDANSDN